MKEITFKNKMPKNVLSNDVKYSPIEVFFEKEENLKVDRPLYIHIWCFVAAKAVFVRAPDPICGMRFDIFRTNRGTFNYV